MTVIQPGLTTPHYTVTELLPYPEGVHVELDNTIVMPLQQFAEYLNRQGFTPPYSICMGVANTQGGAA